MLASSVMDFFDFVMSRVSVGADRLREVEQGSEAGVTHRLELESLGSSFAGCG